MDIFRKIILLIIIVIFSYILYRIMQKRMVILSEFKEGFEDATVKRLQSSNKANLQINSLNLSNLTTKNGISPNILENALQLQNYCI